MATYLPDISALVPALPAPLWTHACSHAEYTPKERAEGLHNNSLKFAMESKSERGWSTSGKDANATPAPVKAPVGVHVAAGTI
jgi:hypothetical protein